MSTFVDIVGWAVIGFMVLVSAWSAWAQEWRWTVFFTLGAVVIAYGILAEPGWCKMLIVVAGGLLFRLIAKWAKAHDTSTKGM